MVENPNPIGGPPRNPRSARHVQAASAPKWWLLQGRKPINDISKTTKDTVEIAVKLLRTETC